MKISDLPPAVVAKVAHMLGTSADMDLPSPTGWYVMVMQYVRPAKSAGGILWADQTKQEDIYQGRCGLVLAVGPDAYSDQAKFPNGDWCGPGDWVVWPSLGNAASRIKYGDLVLAMLPDDQIMLTGVDPEQTIKG